MRRTVKYKLFWVKSGLFIKIIESKKELADLLSLYDGQIDFYPIFS